MLTYLTIKNFAIIDAIELDFKRGLTVVTGETGAGKSLIVDTLELVLGGRADGSVVRAGTERCEITAIFDLTESDAAREWLSSREFENSDNSTECIISRSITKDSRSRSTINDHPCTQQLARELGGILVSLHGQHEHQALLKLDKQLEILDAFAENQTQVRALKNIYQEWQNLAQKIIELESLASESTSKIDLLSYQLGELENISTKFQLTEDAIADLHHEHSVLCNAEDIIANCDAAVALISQNETSNILRSLQHAQTHVEKIIESDPKIKNALELLQTAGIHITESLSELERYAASTEVNQDKALEISANLDEIYSLARKYHVKPEEIPALAQKIASELNTLKNSAQLLDDAKIARATLEEKYYQIAEKISAKRKKGAAKLNALVTANMQQLGMPNGKFVINFIAPTGSQSPTAYGLERCEFCVSANAGHPEQPLAKTASGGELSRISLSLQVILATQALAPTLIFDEVDVGIGGKTAAIVGKMLRELAEHSQIICVTHLPQVAAFGHEHFKVEKTAAAKNHTAITTINLSAQEKINEIARMLGGVEITKSAIAHAKEMIESAAT